MRTFDFKSPALSAVAFFGTLGILSVGYSAYSSLSAVTSGQPLTVGMWTQVKDNFDNLNARTANVLSSGTYVGIGTSSPISTLTVKSTNNSGYLWGISSVEFGNANYWSMIAKNSGFLYFGNDNGVDGIKDRIAFSPTGRVGIGTISPVAQLDVRSSSGSTYALFAQNTADVVGGTTSIARFQTSNASNYGIWIEGQDVDNSNRSVRIGSLSGISWGNHTPIDFSAGSADRVRIDTTGNILVGKKTTDLNVSGTTIYPNGAIQLSNPTTSLGGEFMILNNNTTGTHTNTAIQFRRNNVAVGGITFNNASTNYATTSDYRLKENVAGLTNALDRIEKLPVHRFNYKSDPTKTIDGFIAHEVQSVVPEAVIGKKDAIDENGAPVYQQVDYSKVVPLLTAGIRELKAASDKKDAEIAELRKEIEALKNQ